MAFAFYHRFYNKFELFGSGSTRPETNSASESTRPRVNSAGSTRPLILFLLQERYF